MNPLVQVFLALAAIISSIGSPLVVWFVNRSAKTRDDQLGAIDATLVRLTEKVGAQNGRVAKLETWQAESTESLRLMEERQWSQRKPSQSRRRK